MDAKRLAATNEISVGGSFFISQYFWSSYNVALRRADISIVLGKEVPGNLKALLAGQNYGAQRCNDFVTVRTSTFNTNQQFSIRSVQQVQYQSITNYKFQQISITCVNLVRDQGVGGSNPLSPTNLFKHINNISGFSSTAV